MNTQLVRVISTALFAVVLHAAVAMAQTAAPPRIVVPEVPATLRVPAGHSVFLHGVAAGTQNYVCVAAGNTLGWRFLGPQATLYATFKGEPRQQITTHFLSADATPERVARPVWQDSADTSRVWGRVLAASTDSAYVAAGAIPWLLLEAAAVEPGFRNRGALATTTFIHRVNTSAGVAPSTGCSEAAHVGTMALVPYTTDYFFYRADRGR